MIAIAPRARVIALAAAALALVAWRSPPREIWRRGIAHGAFDHTATEHHFTIATDDGVIVVDYDGVLPDTVHDGAEVRVHGDDHGGQIDADVLLAKCPS